MECNQAQKNISSLIKGTLKGNVLRRTYYHIIRCDTCKDILLDEFSFYTAFNDKDLDLDFNYKNKLQEFLNKVEKKIKGKDSKVQGRYILYSIILCLLGALMVGIAISLVYK